MPDAFSSCLPRPLHQLRVFFGRDLIRSKCAAEHTAKSTQFPVDPRSAMGTQQCLRSDIFWWDSRTKAPAFTCPQSRAHKGPSGAHSDSFKTHRSSFSRRFQLSPSAVPHNHRSIGHGFGQFFKTLRSSFSRRLHVSIFRGSGLLDVDDYSATSEVEPLRIPQKRHPRCLFCLHHILCFVLCLHHISTASQLPQSMEVFGGLRTTPKT